MSALEEATDGLLARRAADGDELAFAVIVRRHAAYLRAVAARLVGTGESDDAVQDALITAWDRLPDLADPNKLRSWLATIVARKATDRLRARRDSVPIDGEDPESPADGPEQRAVLGSQLEALRAAVSALPEDLRITWTLREYAGSSYEEIAERTEVPVSTVRGRLARARERLIESMSEWRDG